MLVYQISTQHQWNWNMTLVPQKEISAPDTKRVIGGNEKGLPESLRPFFWDVDFQSLYTRDKSFFIISRLLEHGDELSIRFLLGTYREDEIIHVLRTSRSLSRRSRCFWMIYFDLEGGLCSPKQYPPPCGTCSSD
jgi:hypothetical protein